MLAEQPNKIIRRGTSPPFRIGWRIRRHAVLLALVATAAAWQVSLEARQRHDRTVDGAGSFREHLERFVTSSSIRRVVGDSAADSARLPSPQPLRLHPRLFFCTFRHHRILQSFAARLGV